MTTNRPTTKKPTKKATTRQPANPYKVTPANVKDITIAQDSLKMLLAKTKQYPSTVEYWNHVQVFLTHVKSFYAIHTGGVLSRDVKSPYTVEEVRRYSTEAKQIYTYARNHTNKEQTEGLYKPVAKVFDLFDKRVRMMEGLEESSPDV